jgi:hypothetical protein
LSCNIAGNDDRSDGRDRSELMLVCRHDDLWLDEFF